MTDPESEPVDEEGRAHETRLHKLEAAVEQRLRAAEVAMEEAAGYGEVTATVKGAEAAAAPETELGTPDEDTTSG